MRPQSAIVETSDFGQGVEAAAMSVASEILQLLQFTKDREIGVCAEARFSSGRSAILLRRRCWRRADGSKEVGRIMLEFTLLARDSENYNIIYWL